MAAVARLRDLEASYLLWIGFVAVLAFLVLYPLFWLLAGSVYSPQTGGLTLANFVAREIFGRNAMASGDAWAIGGEQLQVAGVQPLPIGVAVLRLRHRGLGVGRAECGAAHQYACAFSRSWRARMSSAARATRRRASSSIISRAFADGMRFAISVR